MSRAWPLNVVTRLTFCWCSHVLSHCATENEQIKVKCHDSLAQGNRPCEIKREHMQNYFILWCAWTQGSYSFFFPFEVLVRHLAKRGLFSVLRTSVSKCSETPSLFFSHIPSRIGDSHDQEKNQLTTEPPRRSFLIQLLLLSRGWGGCWGEERKGQN